MKKKPNFLILLSDQQRFDTINAAGYKHMKTPNLDRIANEGCVFKNAYTPNPVCMPARHYLMTGQPAKLHGYYGNIEAPIKDEGIPTIPQALSDNGYNTAAIGKMHFYPPRRHHGFDEMHLMEEIPESRLDDAYLQYLEEQGLGELRNIHGVRPAKYHTPQDALMPEEHHGSNWVAKKTVKWLEKNGDEPFFLMCGWIKPHPPWNVPEKHRDMYSDAELPEAIPGLREFPFEKGPSDWFGDNDSEEDKRKIREAYYTSVSMVDTAVGKVLDCLEEQGLLDNTFIIYTSDHGEMLQDKGFYSKGLPYESSAHIPFMVRYPKLYNAGSSNDDFVDLMDLFPTILEVAGIDYNYKEIHKKYPLRGESIIDRAAKRKYQFVEYATGRSRWAMVRDEKFKYCHYYNGGTEFFYDMEKDPMEADNLIGSEALPIEDCARLKAACLEIEKERAPEGCVKDGYFQKLPAEVFDPSCDCSKFPAWANMQFQRFGKESAAKEGNIFLEEFKNAMAIYEPEATARKIFKDPRWQEILRENLESIGGDKDAFNKMLEGC